MRTQLRLAIAFTSAFVPAIVVAQHEGHQAGAPEGSAEMAQCARAQPAVDNIVAGAMARLESARQSNNPADMRAAVEHVEAALRDIRVQLAPCSAATTATDPHAGHAMPNMQRMPGMQQMPGMRHPDNPVAPATQPPPAAANPHVGHSMPMGSAASSRAQATKPAPRTQAGKPAGDAHAGHAIPGASAASKRASTSTPTPSKPAPQSTTDPHAGHAAQQPSGKQMDPVNGLMVDPSSAKKTIYRGQTYYFSSEQTLKEFLRNPAKFTRKPKG